jgi:hypothetical protein
MDTGSSNVRSASSISSRWGAEGRLETRRPSVTFGWQPCTRFRCGFWTRTASIDVQERGEREGGWEGIRGSSTEMIPTGFGGGLHGLRREIVQCGLAIWGREERVAQRRGGVWGGCRHGEWRRFWACGRGSGREARGRFHVSREKREARFIPMCLIAIDGAVNNQPVGKPQEKVWWI